MRNAGRPFSFLYVITGLLIIAVLAMLFLESSAASPPQLYLEDNLIENLTVVLYLSVIAYLLLVASGNRRFRYYSAFVVLLFALRELDMHRFSESILKFSYYMKPQISLVEKLSAGAVVLICTYVLVRYTISYKGGLVSGLRRLQGYALTTVAALLITLISKLLDQAPKILHKHFAITLSGEEKVQMLVIEETLELGIPLLMLLACLQYWTFKRG